MPRPRSLDHAAIASAALAVADRGGLPALSMRTVAAELGVATMSVYRYVGGRDEIERLIVDQILRGADPSVSPHADWEQQVRELTHAIRSAVADHVAVIPLLLAGFQHSPAAWRWLETLLSVLGRAGFTVRQRIFAVRCLQAYVIGALQGEFAAPLSGTGTSEIAALPPDLYPCIVETASIALSVPPDAEFAHGLTIILEGLKRVRNGPAGMLDD